MMLLMRAFIFSSEKVFISNGNVSSTYFDMPANSSLCPAAPLPIAFRILRIPITARCVATGSDASTEATQGSILSVELKVTLSRVSDDS